MVYKCCVPNCRGNYEETTKVAVFSFPKNEDLRQKWITAIHRKDFYPTNNSKVCQLHFPEDQIQWTAEAYDTKTGVKVSKSLLRPRLKESAVPTIFPNSPTYFSVKVCSRENVHERQLRKDNEHLKFALSESVKTKKSYDQKYSFNSFSEFIKCISTWNSGNWSVIRRDNLVMFITLSANVIPTISASATVSENLELKLFKGNNELHMFHGVKYPRQIHNIHDLDCLQLLSVSNDNYLIEDIIQNSVMFLEKLCSINSDLEKQVSFLCEQIKLLSVNKNNFRYSPDFLIFCSLLFTISPHAYRYLRSIELFILPHPNTLHKICNKYSCSPNQEQSDANFLAYIKQKHCALTENDCIVSLMIDEIYLKPYFDYKGGDIVGKAYDSEEAAKTAHVFMIQSIKTSFKDVVHILPVNKINSLMLFSVIKKIIIKLHSIGFHVVCVVSDNNSINRKAMSNFSTPPKLEIVYKHPADSEKMLFYLFDPVHILKCIRNNWLNQKDLTLIYPKFDSFDDCNCKAAFADVKMLYNIECTKLVRYAYSLNVKCLNPSSFERQNVKLALNVFNESVIQGLNEIGKQLDFQTYKTTADFIEIILKWWQVVNVKTLKKDLRFQNLLMSPLAPGQENYKYLQDCLAWLDYWKECTNNNTITPKRNTLTNETHLAFSHSTYALLQLTEYCVNELGFQYILPSKFQTDSLEARFGKYRTMAGSQYLLSIRQIFEVESKLRLQSLLPLSLNSNDCGNLYINLCNITTNELNDSPQHNSTPNVHEFEFNLNYSEDDVSEAAHILPILTYLSGYCAQSIIKKLHCHHCSNNLVVDKELSVLQSDKKYDLIKNLDRGKLLYPTSDVVNVVLFNYITINKLINKDNESKFLSSNNQRQLLIKLSSNIIIEHNFFLSDFYCENKNHTANNLLYSILKTSSNIFLNKYIKSRNNVLCDSKKKKRKIDTVTS